MTVETHPLNPDSDGDGLTDGQEVRWFTVADEVETAARPGPAVPWFVGTLGATHETNATTPDTDGDGYWDGWIGVRGYETKSARRRRKP